MTLQVLYEATTPSTSKANVPTGNPEPLVGYQKDQKLKERQREQQRAERQVAKTPKNFRTILNTNKRAREQANTNRTPNHSPAQQPEARRVRLVKELLSASEAQQLDITARDAVRLQREIPATAAKTDPNSLRYETVTSIGD